MSTKEERDWSEIIEEVREKAKKDTSSFVEETEARLKELVAKVRKANFREEAEELLGRIKRMAEDLSEHTKSSKSSSAQKPSDNQTVRVIFQNPSNPKETYASRGPKPPWMKDLDQKGTAARRVAIINWEDLGETTRKRFE